MGIKSFIKLVLLHIFLFCLGFALFIISFRLPLFKNFDVLFYRGIVLLLCVCVVIAFIILILKRVRFGKLLTYRDLILNITIILSFSMLFFTHLPITADRSVSVFLLGYMNNNSEKILTTQDMNTFFIDRYVYNYGAMERRVSEQIVSGNIEAAENGYRITARGKMLMKLYDVIGDVFNINKKFISP